MAITLDGSDGVLTTSLDTIYTATGPEVVIGVTMINVSSASVVVSAYVDRTGTPRALLFEEAMAKGAAWRFPEAGPVRHTLQVGDTIKAIASSGAAVHYIVSVIGLT